MTKTHIPESQLWTKPDGISETPRHSKEGEVVAEVGFRHQTSEGDHWKVIQRLEMPDGRVEIRFGYYKWTGNQWMWMKHGDLMLPVALYVELHARATKEGLFTVQ